MAKEDVNEANIRNLSKELDEHKSGCAKIGAITDKHLHFEKHIIECEADREELRNLVQGAVKCQEEAELIQKTVKETRKFHLWLASTVGGGILGVLYFSGQFIVSNLDALKTFWNSISSPK